MKLEPPLKNLISRCETICVSDCCGLDAYDFSPIHIASYLILYRGDVDERDIAAIKAQIESLRANYGENGVSAKGVIIECMNQNFTAKGISSLCNEILHNLQTALSIVQQTNSIAWHADEL